MKCLGALNDGLALHSRRFPAEVFDMMQIIFGEEKQRV